MVFADHAIMLSAVALAALMVFTRQGWIVARYGATLTHELGHAVFSLLTRGNVTAIRLYGDSSGGTHINRKVRIFPLGAIISSFFGYPSPLIFGSVFLSMLALDMSNSAQWGIFGAGVVTLLFIRNPFGLLVTAIWIASSGAVLFYAPQFIPWFVLWTGFILVFGGFKDLWVLHSIYKTTDGTDLHDLRENSHLPLAFWHWVMWIVSIAVICLPAYLSILLLSDNF